MDAISNITAGRWCYGKSPQGEMKYNLGIHYEIQLTLAKISSFHLA